ncbi:receptor-type tyrosine-protein phosphatase F [Naviculisporaceae sp. PSN 640]
MASTQSHINPEPTMAPQPLKVMIVGDSISHGSEGDYTWRYRIWEWLHLQQKHTNSGLEIHFVGPYQGTYPPDKPSPPRPPPLQSDRPPPRSSNPPSGGGYAVDADPHFLDPENSSHASANGLQLLQAKHLIARQIRTYRPDICLVQLGFNDLTWCVTGPGETLRSMKEFVDNARSEKHDIKFTIANVPFRTAISGFPELPGLTSVYNDLLEKATEQWDNEVSPVQLVRLCENYECGLKTSKASYDGLHPNELGEYQIAQAFSKTLMKAPFNLGDKHLHVPQDIPPPLTHTPSNFKARPAPSGLVVTWDHVYGARWYELRARLVSSSRSSSRSKREREWSTFRLSAPRHDTMRCLPGQKYEYQVRTCEGDELHSLWTDIVSARVGHDLSTLPGPRDIVTHATATGFNISWSPPEGSKVVEIDRYGVWWWEIKDGASGTGGGLPTAVGVKGTSAEISGLGLIPGRRYGIAVDTWTKYGAGLFAVVKSVVVGRGVPLAPTCVEVQIMGPSSAEVSWSGGTDAAAGFRVWVRRLGRGACSGMMMDESDHWAYSKCSETSCKVDEEAARLYCEVTAPRAPQIANVRVMRQTVTGLRRPSVWGYEFAVSAFNGSDESPLSEWVRAPLNGSLGETKGSPVGFHGAWNSTRVIDTDTLDIGIAMVVA